MVQTNFKQKYSFPANSSLQKLTFEEYLEYEDNTDTKYELYKGHLIPMATATGLHTKICKYLAYQFQSFFADNDLSLVAISDVGVRTEIDSSRIPDLVICSSQFWQDVCNRKGAGVFDLQETPQLVIEVSSENWREDYNVKRAEYALIEIPEYWIVNPHEQIVRIFNRPPKGEGYEYVDFVLGENTKSLLFPQLVLSVDEILSPPMVEELIKAEKTEKKQLELGLETERQRAETERQRAETERQRAEKLENLLREKGIDF